MSLPRDARDVRHAAWADLPAWDVVDALASGDSMGARSPAVPQSEEVIRFLAGCMVDDPAAFRRLLSTLARPADDIFRSRLTARCSLLSEVPRESLRPFAREIDALTRSFWRFYWKWAPTDARLAVQHMQEAIPALARAGGRVDGFPIPEWCARACGARRPTERFAAYDALAAMGRSGCTPVVLDRLCHSLSHSDPTTRHLAARVIAELGEAAATPAVVAALCAQVADDRGDMLDAAAQALARLGEAAATPAVVDLLRARTTPAYRHTAQGDLVYLGSHVAEALAQIEGTAAVGPDVDHSATADPAPGEQLEAERQYGDRSEAAATADIIDARCRTLREGPALAKKAAAEALGRMGVTAATPAVLEALYRGLADGRFPTRRASARALARLAADSPGEALGRLAPRLLRVLRINRAIAGPRDLGLDHVPMGPFWRIRAGDSLPLAFGLMHERGVRFYRRWGRIRVTTPGSRRREQRGGPTENH
jgi:hypothetical protein